VGELVANDIALTNHLTPVVQPRGLALAATQTSQIAHVTVRPQERVACRQVGDRIWSVVDVGVTGDLPARVHCRCHGIRSPERSYVAHHAVLPDEGSCLSGERKHGEWIAKVIVGEPSDLAAIVDRQCLAFGAAWQRAEIDDLPLPEQHGVFRRISVEWVKGTGLRDTGANAMSVDLEYRAAVGPR